jgi:nitrite reductase/ring-hydroxylating ferredoxin subunit/uncharacterized membrane protein
MARWLTRLMDTQDVWVKPFGNFLHGIVQAIFRAVPSIRDLLNGRWLGHPIHAVLTDAPIGILFLVIVFDVLGMADAAWWTLAIGILAMLGAALAGFADYAETDGKARDRGTLHSSLMLLALVLFLISLVLRPGLGSGAPVSAAAIALSLVAWLIVAASAYVGGDIVYALGNMVDRHAFRGGGTKWIAMEPGELEVDGSIPEGRPVKAKLGVNSLVLVRNGPVILALHDTCAHAGCSLSGGTLVAASGGGAASPVVECPCHGSRFRLGDGRVLRGPSVYDQPAYEVRQREGGGWEARRQAN